MFLGGADRKCTAFFGCLLCKTLGRGCVALVLLSRAALCIGIILWSPLIRCLCTLNFVVAIWIKRIAKSLLLTDQVSI